MADYISTTETAKLIRAQLKSQFPGVTFSVRSCKYAGGSSIDVSWTDGPVTAAVERVAKSFAGSGFDGMIDMKYSVDSFLLPDGSAVPAGTKGTEGSAGTAPREHRMMPIAGARRVRFAADYVFCNRNVSDNHQAWVRRRWAAMNEAERSAWMQRTQAWQAAMSAPRSWGYDAVLADFGAEARDVFAWLARRTAGAVAA